MFDDSDTTPEELAQKYLEALRSGKKPKADEYLRQLPQAAHPKFWSAVANMAKLKKKS